MSHSAISIALIPEMTDPFLPKSLVALYILCHSTSISKGDWFNNKGFRAELITVADISGGSKPWQKASPQPESPSLVFISTSVAERLFTQPWEKAKGTSNSDFIIWIIISVIFSYFYSLFFK